MFLKVLIGGALADFRVEIYRGKGRELSRFYNHVVFVSIFISTDYESNRLQVGLSNVAFKAFTFWNL